MKTHRLQAALDYIPEIKPHELTSANLKAYGLSNEEYDNLHANQGGRCAVCGIKPSLSDTQLAVDHCHTTGTVRGLLCSKCNTSLGLINDSVDNLYNAISYLTCPK